jgi:hypothetical protein
MLQTFCTSGRSEWLKGSVHSAAGGLAFLMALYNTVAWYYRREPHLKANALFYGATVAWEIQQTRHHWERCAEPAVLVIEPPALVMTSVGLELDDLEPDD